MLHLFIDLLEAASLSALGLVIYSALRPFLAHRPAALQNALFGLLFGLIAVVSILGGSSPWGGVILDGRNVMLTIAGLFGGPIGGTIAAALTAAGRIAIAASSAPAIVGICAVTAASIAIGVLARRRAGAVTHRWLVLAAISAAAARVGVLLLWQSAGQSEMEVAKTAALVAAANFAGVMLIGTLMIREERRVQLEQQLRDTTRELYHLTTTDGLTGLATRRYLLQRLDDEILRATRYGHAASLMILDLDHFKRVNDGHGHATGTTSFAPSPGRAAIRSEKWMSPAELAARNLPS